MYLIALTPDEWSIAVQVVEGGNQMLASKIENAKTVGQLMPKAVEAAAREHVSSWDHLDHTEIKKAMPDVRNQVRSEVKAALESVCGS